MHDDLERNDQAARLAALHSYRILDTPREPDFDDIAALAAKICGAPISVINLIEDHRQWFKAEVGLGIRETPLDVSICRHVLLQPGITEIADLRQDERMCLNPLVTEDAGLRFYAGCLLQAPDGQGIGTLCILDRTPRSLSDDQRSALRTLANQVMAQMELRRSLRLKTELVEQKEMLIKEVNHRTKNNLQLILSLIQLQIMRLDNENARAPLEDTARRIMSVARVHERLYQADQVNAVDAASYLKEVIEGIKATVAGAFTFDVDLEPLVLPLDSAIPLSLIVNEMVTNALKHAYEGRKPGKIRIMLKQADGCYHLSVTDYGRGLAAGFDFRRSRSMGMRIIDSLAKQIQADVVFRDNSPGVECRLIFGPPVL
jgi:two-component sensor histidine kinase